MKNKAHSSNLRMSTLKNKKTGADRLFFYQKAKFPIDRNKYNLNPTIMRMGLYIQGAG